MNLIVEDVEGRKSAVPVAGDEITIGRGDGNVVRLAEKDVSRRHGRLVRERGQFYVEDLGSFTGIRVNGEKVRGRRLLREGDLIQISAYDLSLQAEEKKPVPAGKPAPDEAAKRKLAETATIRLSDLRGPGGDGPAQDVPEAQRPRLVGISGAYRGKELVLDRTPSRLGRSAENDLEIDHPSISRQQCRLHLDAGTWKVLDAQSRNGVRVNGEPYASIGLRHGDVLEIGHLRFAFVEPGKDFELPPEFAPMQPALGPLEPRKPAGLLVGAGVAVAMALAAVAFLLGRQRAAPAAEKAVEVAQAAGASAPHAAEEAPAAHRDEALHDPGAGAAAPAVTATSVAPDAVPRAPPAHRAATRPAADDSQPRRLLTEGNQKLMAQDFDGALALFEEALSLKPSNPVLGSLYRSMGIAFTRQGNVEQGARYYRLYLPFCTNPQEKAQLQQVLDDYQARAR